MTSIIERLKNSDERDSDALVTGLDIRTQAFIDGAYVDALSGETFDCVSPITGGRSRRSPSCDSADVDRAVAARARAFESGSWSRAAPQAAQEGPAAGSPTLMRGARRRAGAARDARHGQADPRQPPGRRARSPPKRSPTTARRSTRSTTRSRRPSSVERRDDRARAARRRRRGRAVELPAADGRLEARPGARDRQLGRPEARRAVVADRAPAGRAGRRGRSAGRRAAGRPRLRRDGRPARSACIRTSTWSRSPARPRSASCSCATAASRT